MMITTDGRVVTSFEGSGTTMTEERKTAEKAGRIGAFL
jgi:hypothetical protein